MAALVGHELKRYTPAKNPLDIDPKVGVTIQHAVNADGRNITFVTFQRDQVDAKCFIYGKARAAFAPFATCARKQTVFVVVDDLVQEEGTGAKPVEANHNDEKNREAKMSPSLCVLRVSIRKKTGTTRVKRVGTLGPLLMPANVLAAAKEAGGPLKAGQPSSLCINWNETRQRIVDLKIAGKELVNVTTMMPDDPHTVFVSHFSLKSGHCFLTMRYHEDVTHLGSTICSDFVADCA